MVVCVWLPQFALRVLARAACEREEPVAIALPGAVHPRVVECTPEAAREGVEPQMLVSHALGRCAQLQVVDLDTPRVDEVYERFLARLEGMGAAVEPRQWGMAFFALAPLERLYGGRGGVLAQVRHVFRKAGDLRLGVAPNLFSAQVAARLARPNEHFVIGEETLREKLAPLPTSMLPADRETIDLLAALGLDTLGDFAALDEGQVTDRFGEPGVQLWRLSRGDDRCVLKPRAPSEDIVEQIEFPDALGNLVSLRRALELLIERALDRKMFATYAPRTVIVTAACVTGSSWQVQRVLREPTVNAKRIALSACARLEEIQAPVQRLQVRFADFALRDAAQAELAPEGLNQRSPHNRGEALVKGIEHVQAALGDETMLQVLEVEPWSRIPERHAVLVPRQVGSAATSAGEPA